MKKQEVQSALKEDKNQAYSSLEGCKKNCFDGMKGYSEINSKTDGIAFSCHACYTQSNAATGK